MLGIRTHQDSNNIHLLGMEFTLVKPQVRSELIWSSKLYNNSYQIDYKVRFPEVMPSGWCVCLQLLQAADNGVKNPTLQMNVADSMVRWQHKTDLVGAGDVFCESPFIPNVENHWQILINVSKKYYPTTSIVIKKDGDVIGRITGQTIVDVDEQPLLKYGLYSRAWNDKPYRRSIVTKLEVTKI